MYIHNVVIVQFVNQPNSVNYIKHMLTQLLHDLITT